MIKNDPNNSYIWLMTYNWQQKDWPDFAYEECKVKSSPINFGIKAGELSGLITGMPDESEVKTVIELIVAEAIKTSEIEGEFMSRDEVMSSVKNHLGVHEDQPAQVHDLRAKGIAELMILVRNSFSTPLSEKMLFQWYKALMKGNRKVKSGVWRSHEEPMQIISGQIGKEKVHFEAPPSIQVPQEMKQFIQWFNATAPSGKKPINDPIVRSAIAHLYFESIHPFEDGNGRIGRAISDKAISQGLGHPVILSMSTVIEANKKAYYKNLKSAQRTNHITDWINYFSRTVEEAQIHAEKIVRFSLKKTKFYDRFGDVLNSRQHKTISKMLDAGHEGFEGGMTAKKYMSITKTSKATATRDLGELVSLGVLDQEGGGRSVSYQIILQ